jgi:hypothetical protein
MALLSKQEVDLWIKVSDCASNINGSLVKLTNEAKNVLTNDIYVLYIGHFELTKNHFSFRDADILYKFYKNLSLLSELLSQTPFLFNSLSFIRDDSNCLLKLYQLPTTKKKIKLKILPWNDLPRLYSEFMAIRDELFAVRKKNEKIGYLVSNHAFTKDCLLVKMTADKFIEFLKSDIGKAYLKTWFMDFDLKKFHDKIYDDNEGITIETIRIS